MYASQFGHGNEVSEDIWLPGIFVLAQVQYFGIWAKTEATHASPFYPFASIRLGKEPEKNPLAYSDQLRDERGLYWENMQNGPEGSSATNVS